MTVKVEAKKRRDREKQKKIDLGTYVPRGRPTLRHPDGRPLSRTERLARRRKQQREYARTKAAQTTP